MKQSKNEKPLALGKPPSQMKGKQWYLRDGNIMQVQEMINKIAKSKPISYLKIYHPSRGGAETTIQHWKTLDNGFMVCVDLASMCIKIVRGFSGMRSISGSTKKDFDKAYDQLMKILKK